MESRIGYTSYGIAHGAISETLNHEKETPSYNALPEEIIYPIGEFDKRHVKFLMAVFMNSFLWRTKGKKSRCC